jgi:hypothetical protein
MSELEEAAAEVEATAMRGTLRLGRILVWAAILPYALLEIVVLALELSQAATLRAAATVVRVVLEVTLVWVTLGGSPGARRLLAFFCGAGLVGSFLLLLGANGLASVLLGLSAIECGFAFWVFGVSTAAKGYLDSNAQAATG